LFRRITLLVAVTVVMAAMMAVSAGAALADPPGVEFRNGPANELNANCIGIASSDAIHNGQAGTLGQGGDPSHGARGDEIKAAQALPFC
jgi:hypothetical protein